MPHLQGIDQPIKTAKTLTQPYSKSSLKLISRPTLACCHFVQGWRTTVNATIVFLKPCCLKRCLSKRVYNYKSLDPTLHVQLKTVQRNPFLGIPYFNGRVKENNGTVNRFARQPFPKW